MYNGDEKLKPGPFNSLEGCLMPGVMKDRKEKGSASKTKEANLKVMDGLRWMRGSDGFERYRSGPLSRTRGLVA